MRSLALKIFLAFWALHALIFLALALLPDPNRNARLFDRVQHDGVVAASLYEGRDAEACAAFLASVERAGTARVVLYTPALDPVCRSNADIDDAPYRSVVRKADARGVLEKVGDREVGAMPIDGPSGRAYRVAFFAKSSTPLDPWRPAPPLFFLVAATIVSGVMCFLVARYLAAPLRRVRTATHRLKEGDLLVAGEREQAEAPDRLVPFDLSAVVGQVGDDAHYEAERADKRVVRSGEEQAIVIGDPVLAAGAIGNVVRNAVRHTAPGTDVSVVVERAGPFTKVVVRDHGPGVPVADLERIFLPFVRLDSSRNRESGGIGLGLSIGRRSVTMMGGTIAASNAEGGGLQVTISLPLAG